MVIKDQLAQLFEQFQIKWQQKTGHLAVIDHDELWLSPCEIMETLSDGKVQWQAVVQPENNNMRNLDTALEIRIHQDVSDYYASFYSDNLEVTSPWGPLVLLQAWSELDYSQLQQNLLGHIMMKRKLKQAETVFIGLTEKEDLLVTMMNDTGAIWLEYVGKEPHQQIAENMHDFLAQLTVN